MTSSEKDSLPIIAYEDLEKRNIAKSWYGKIQNIMSQIGFRYVWLNKNTTTNLDLTLYHIKQRLKDIEMQIWSSEINNDTRTDKNHKNKLRTYRQFKTDFKREEYLLHTPIVKHRIAMTKLRISNHCLEIERGRYARPYKKVEQRLCPSCPNKVEDEIHFTLQCKTYEQNRNILLESMEKITNLDLSGISEKSLFHKIMNPPPKLCKTAAKFIYDCFKLRECQK